MTRGAVRGGETFVFFAYSSGVASEKACRPHWCTQGAGSGENVFHMSPPLAQQFVSLRAVPAPTGPLHHRAIFHGPRTRRRAGQRAAALADDTATGAPAAAAAALSEAELEQRLVKAAGLISNSHLLVPYDSGTVNLALEIW